ncbi:hypothetical protein ACFX1W_046798 [Malus domestica]
MGILREFGSDLVRVRPRWWVLRATCRISEVIGEGKERVEQGRVGLQDQGGERRDESGPMPTSCTFPVPIGFQCRIRRMRVGVSVWIWVGVQDKEEEKEGRG